jgi:hypothetical protein
VKRAASWRHVVLGAALAASLGAATARAADANTGDAGNEVLTPNDFAYGVKVPSPGDAAAYRAPLPLAVYQKVLRGDLGDVRVFNERDEIVPYRVERPLSQSAVQAPPVSLPLFILRDDSREALDAIRMTIESGGTRIEIRAPPGTRAPRVVADAQPGASSATARSGSKGSISSVASYVLDGRALTSPVASFQLTWPDDAPDYAGRLRIEASDDLGSWRTVVTGAPVANLRAGAARIVERRVELAGVNAKFWRLSWADAPAPFELTSVIAEPARDRLDVTRSTLSVAGTPVPGKPGEFAFDLGARVPADRITLELPEQNSIVEADVLSRAHPTDPWRYVAHGGFYRLKATRPVATSDSTAVEANADLTNGSLAIDPSSDRHWLARIDMRTGGLGRGAPKLRVGWLPHEIVFLARGNGPFTLAYGSSKARPTTELGAIPNGVFVVSATFTLPETLGGDARLQPVEPPQPALWSKSATLWTVLAIGVALLAFMAYRLSRELKQGQRARENER